MFCDPFFSPNSKSRGDGLENLLIPGKRPSSEEDVRILFTNIQCLSNKIEALENTTKQLNPQIVCIAEHWLHKHNARLFAMEGYSMGDLFVRQRYTHGGVCIYVNTDINSIPVSEIGRLSAEKACEMACIYIPGYNLVVMAVYRSPDSDHALFQEILGDAMETLLQKYSVNVKIAIAGDFNVDLKRASTQTKALQNFMSSYGHKATVWDYTRVQGNSKTVLDNVYTNVKENTVKVLPGLSDHHDILFTTKVRKGRE